MKIYTRTGDAGETGLLGGGRVAKDHPRIRVFGDLDELNALLGMARAHQLPLQIDELVERIQHELFTVGAEMATADPENVPDERTSDEHICRLEADIDSLESQVDELTCFILPAGPLATTVFHLARCVCRRCERELVALAQQEPVRPQVLRYVNRLSDLLFVAARATAKAQGAGETPWRRTS